MNENLNLVEILKDCPKGTKLYSSLFGEVEFNEIEDEHNCPIRFTTSKGLIADVTSDGRYFELYSGECTLFPSREQRDWSKFKPKQPKFDPKTLQPFDKVLVKAGKNPCRWNCALFSHIDYRYGKYLCCGFDYEYCIPYNDDTKHLVGTTKEPPEFYRYWED